MTKKIEASRFWIWISPGLLFVCKKQKQKISDTVPVDPLFDDKKGDAAGKKDGLEQI
jgi:hypothetical protein